MKIHTVLVLPKWEKERDLAVCKAIIDGEEVVYAKPLDDDEPNWDAESIATHKYPKLTDFQEVLVNKDALEDLKVIFETVSNGEITLRDIHDMSKERHIKAAALIADAADANEARLAELAGCYYPIEFCIPLAAALILKLPRKKLKQFVYLCVDDDLHKALCEQFTYKTLVIK